MTESLTRSHQDCFYFVAKKFQECIDDDSHIKLLVIRMNMIEQQDVD
jgi:hypothetical protein